MATLSDGGIGVLAHTNDAVHLLEDGVDLNLDLNLFLHFNIISRVLIPQV